MDDGIHCRGILEDWKVIDVLTKPFLVGICLADEIDWERELSWTGGWACVSRRE